MSFKKILSCVLLLSTVFTVCASADAAETVNGKIVTEYYTDDIYKQYAVETAAVPIAAPPSVDAKSVVLMEAATGEVLYENNSHEVLPPASITKIMTMLLIAEAIDDGSLKLTDSVSTSEHAASMGGSQIWLEPGESMTVEHMLKAVAVGSANDASVALAEHIAGSEESFVSLMNGKAKELGMKDTVFHNACGLDTDGHVSSAYDVALMSRELISHECIKQFTTIWMDSLRGGETQLVNTNKLIRYYMGATGLKTGTTDKAKFCLSATAKRDGMELIAVVMGASSSNERFAGGKKLLDYGFANWCVATPSFDESALGDVPVKMGQKPTVGVQIEPIKSQLVKSGDKSKITTKLNMSEEIEAPAVEGTKVGTLEILVDGNKINEYSVYISESVNRINFGYMLCKMFEKLTTL